MILKMTKVKKKFSSSNLKSVFFEVIAVMFLSDHPNIV
jgi:hypothetical protein